MNHPFMKKWYEKQDVVVQSPVFVGDLLRKQFRISKGSTDSSGNWSGIESAGPGDV